MPAIESGVEIGMNEEGNSQPSWEIFAGGAVCRAWGKGDTARDAESWRRLQSLIHMPVGTFCSGAARALGKAVSPGLCHISGQSNDFHIEEEATRLTCRSWAIPRLEAPKMEVSSIVVGKLKELVMRVNFKLVGGHSNGGFAKGVGLKWPGEIWAGGSSENSLGFRTAPIGWVLQY